MAKSVGRKHPVNHSKGPVRTPANTRSSVTAASAKNSGGISVVRGVRTVPNTRVSGVGGTTTATNTNRATSGRGVRIGSGANAKTL